MDRVKKIATFSLAMVMLMASSGFAIHTIHCAMKGERYLSITESSCCCEKSNPKPEKKCCNEEKSVVKVNSEDVHYLVNAPVNPVFVASFVSGFFVFSFPQQSLIPQFAYLKHAPPLIDRELIIRVQSFLI